MRVKFDDLYGVQFGTTNSYEVPNWGHMYTWCKEKFGYCRYVMGVGNGEIELEQNWLTSYASYYFVNESDYVEFCLRWT